MNGKKAKKLRRLIYGDFSQRQREYEEAWNGEIRCVGLRRAYQESKKRDGLEKWRQR